MAILLAPTANFVTKTLNGSITDSQTTITLSSTTNLQAPGVVVIDRVDTNGVSQPTLREIVSFTGIAGNDITGCSRGADNSNASAHADGALVETNPTVGTWNSMATAIFQFADSNGYINAINSPVSIAIGQFKSLAVASFASIGFLAVPSLASIAVLNITTRLDVSAASVTGIGLFPAWRGSGAYSGPTTAVGGLLVMPRAGTIKWASFITRTVASGASVQVDFMNNGSSIFAGVTAPRITGGGTYVSTASINTAAVLPGQVFRFDVKTLTGPGHIIDITGQLGLA